MKLLDHLTAGRPRDLVKPIVYTTLANLAGVLPFVLLVESARLIFEPFVHPGTPLDAERLWWICGLLALAVPLVFLCEIPAYRAQFRSAYGMAAEGRTRLAEHVRKLPLGYLERNDPGSLANRLMNDFTQIETAVSHHVPQLAAAAIMPVLALVGLSLLDWRMALAMFASLPAAALIAWATTGIQRRMGARHQATKEETANRLQEYLNGMAVIIAYNLAGERFVRLEQAFAALRRESVRLEAGIGPIILSAIALLRAGLPLLIVAGVYLLLDGTLDLLVFVAFLLIGTRIFDPLTSALASYSALRYEEQAGERILDLLRQPGMSGDLPPASGSEVELQNVTFGYNEGSVLQDISLRMKSGTLTALVGPSGSGKSTILRLISRFYDPDAGQVLIGGADARATNPEALLSRIAMVFQDVYLFQDTIAGNIRFGRSDATAEEIETAAREACCHDFIMKLPQGYDTRVGEGGSTLSGGERQRIAIARALLKNAPIVLLDEATASLDPENEAEIQRAVERLIQGRTVIAVAHRLKTVQQAEQIVVIDRGRVVEQGRHEDLLAAAGLYARLWRLQQEAEGWTISSAAAGNTGTPFHEKV